MGKNKKASPATNGFTIIEVMIVLAIAALIILAVFLAVPDLQRSHRNNQRKRDAANLLTALGNFEANMGRLPTDTATAGGIVGPESAQVIANASLSFYVDHVTMDTARAAYAPSVAEFGNIKIMNYSKCLDPHTTTANGATPKTLTAVYQIETGASSQTMCLDG